MVDLMSGVFRPCSLPSALFLALALSGCAKTPVEGQSSGPPPALVAVDNVGEGSVEVEWSFLGDVTALRRAELAAGAEGEVRSVTARVGDRVKKGALLVEIDSSLAAARLHAAEASRRAGKVRADQAVRDADRLQRAGSEVVSGAEIEGAGSQVQALTAERERLRAAAREAREELGRHTVRAPFDGVIARRLVDPGDWVEQGTQVMEFVDDDEVEVLVNAPPDVVQYVKEGDVAMLERGTERVPATVQGIVRALDTQSRTVRLRLVPNEQAPFLLAGAAVDVKLKVQRQEEGALALPRDALVYTVAGARAVKVVDGKAVPVEIEIVVRGREYVLVRGEGLAVGDQVVTRGNERLLPGQPVSVVPET